MEQKEAKRRVLEARKEFEQGKAKLQELKLRQEKLCAEVPALTDMALEAKRRIGVVMDELLIGKASQEELKTAREDYEMIERNRAETKELIEAMSRTIPRFEQQNIPMLSNNVINAKSAFWSLVAQSIISKIPPEIAGILAEAFAAKLLAGHGNYQALLSSLFPHPSTEQSHVLQQELKAKHGGL